MFCLFCFWKSVWNSCILFYFFFFLRFLTVFTIYVFCYFLCTDVRGRKSVFCICQKQLVYLTDLFECSNANFATFDVVVWLVIVIWLIICQFSFFGLFFVLICFFFSNYNVLNGIYSNIEKCNIRENITCIVLLKKFFLFLFLCYYCIVLCNDTLFDISAIESLKISTMGLFCCSVVFWSVTIDFAFLLCLVFPLTLSY